MKLACDDCPDHNTEACLECKYINKLMGSIYKGRKKNECLSSEGTVPSEDHDSQDYKEVIYNNQKHVKALRYFYTCPESHKVVIALHLFGFSKKKIALYSKVSRQTVYNILALFA